MTTQYTLLSTMAAAGLALSGVAANAASRCAPPLPTMKNGEVTYRSLAAQKAADVNEADVVLARRSPRKVSEFGVFSREVVAGSYVRAAASRETNENGVTTCVEEAEVRQQPTVTAESGLDQVGDFFGKMGRAAGEVLIGTAGVNGQMQPINNSVQTLNNSVAGSSANASVGNVSAAGGAGGSSTSTANATGGNAVAKGGNASAQQYQQQQQYQDQNQSQDQKLVGAQKPQGHGGKKQHCSKCGY